MTQDSANAKLKADLIASIPRLRAFGVSLCGNADSADDLVQETLVGGHAVPLSINLPIQHRRWPL